VSERLALPILAAGFSVCVIWAVDLLLAWWLPW
jgi:hypothetical protein